MPESHDPARPRDSGFERLVPAPCRRRRKVGEVDGIGSFRIDAGHEVLPDRVRQVRHERRDQPGQRGQHLVERLVGSGLVGVQLPFPEPAAVATHVPGGEVLDECLDGSRGTQRVIRVEGGADLARDGVEAGQDPSVEQAATGAVGNAGSCARQPPIKPRIGDEERVRVPEWEEEAADHLVAGSVPEVQVHRRVGSTEHPAHHVRADPLGSLVERDRIGLALVHLVAVLVADQGVAEDGVRHRLIGQHGRHGQQGVEPVTELARERLGDEVGREPLAPVLAIRVPAQGREAHDARVEPRVPDVGDAT